MACSDEEELSYESSYFEELIELSEGEEEDTDAGDDTHTRNGVKEWTVNGGTTPQHHEQPSTTEQANSSPVEKTTVEEPLEESESYEEEEEDDEYIIEEFVEENYEVPLAGSEEEAADHGDDETSFDDNSTAYNPDDDAPIITDEQRHRLSTDTNLEIGKYSDHSMDVDNAFELNLPFIPKSKQMSAVTLDWDIYQDSTSSWGGWGSDEESAGDGNDDTGARPIIVMDERMQDTQGGMAKDSPKLGVARNKSGGKLVRRSSFQRTLSGGLTSRGSLSRTNSGNLRGAIDRTHSGGLVRPMPVLLASSGMPRRKSHGHLIMSPLDTLAEEGTTQLSPFANPEEKINLSRETFSGFDSNQLPPPPPPTDSDNSVGSSDEFGHESHESTEKKDATTSIPQTEHHEPTESEAVHHNLDVQTNDQLRANPQIEADVQNQNLVNIQSMTIHDGELPGEHSTMATNTIHIDGTESAIEHGIHPTIPAENSTNGTIINNRDLERLSKDSTTIFTPETVDSPSETSLAGTLGHGNRGDYKNDDNDTAMTNIDRLTNTIPSSINGRPPIQAPSTKADTQNPVPPSPSRRCPSPGSTSEKSSKMSRSIDQLRRSSHLNLPSVSNHSQASLPRRASKRNVNITNSPGLNSDVASPKAGKVSRFEQLLKRSSAIKAVR